MRTVDHMLDRCEETIQHTGLAIGFGAPSLTLLQYCTCAGPTTIELTYEILGIRPILIDKMILFPKSKYGYRRHSYSLATRRTKASIPSWFQKGSHGHPNI
jgi:hypothetical protein